MSKIDDLIKQASGAARTYGGLVSLLLVVREGNADKIRWKPKEARFVANGTEISFEKLRAELLRIESRLSATVLLYLSNLQEGKWTIEKWREEMKKLLENHHIIFAALALGGIAVAAKNDTVIRRIDRDVDFLKGFAKVIKEARKVGGIIRGGPSAGIVVPKPQITFGALLRRARTYIRSITMTYHLLNHRAHILAGYKEAKRVLTPAEHCRTKAPEEGCLEAAGRGWIDIEKMPPVGTLVCKQFCKCYLIFRR